MFSCTKAGRNKLHSFSKISAEIFSLLNFKMSPHGQLLDFIIEDVFLGWRGCKLFWIHGSWVQEISWFSSHGQIPWASYHLKILGHVSLSPPCASIGRSGPDSLEAVSTSVKRNVLNNRTPISPRFGHTVCGPVGILFTLCIR